MAETSTADMISVNIPEDMAASLERIAAGMNVGRDVLVTTLLKSYLETEGQEVLDILDAQQDVEDGNTVDFDEVLEKMDAIVKGAAA
ncbi:CopG family transcriptional regulator [Rhizobium sp. FKL33]|uniref:CopG family transcriptional regulator n=1 Tax=Rhizobium sp. FKL33 TaxID=2562307 RepID=UPI0010C11E36|nr:CopG family transcriptional regulator [Rhizobium sp. FKL33]